MYQAVDDFIKYYNWPIALCFMAYFFRKEIRLLIKELIDNFDRVKTFSAGASGVNFTLGEMVKEQEEKMTGKKEDFQETDIIKTMGLQRSEVSNNHSSQLWKNGIIIHRFKVYLKREVLNIPQLILFPFSFSSIMSLNILGDIEYKIIELNDANFKIQITSMNEEITEINFIATGM